MTRQSAVTRTGSRSFNCALVLAGCLLLVPTALGQSPPADVPTEPGDAATVEEESAATAQTEPVEPTTETMSAPASQPSAAQNDSAQASSAQGSSAQASSAPPMSPSVPTASHRQAPNRTPAPAGVSNAGSSDREGAADDEPEEDEGDPYDFLWIDAAFTYSYVDLQAVADNNYYDSQFVNLAGQGPGGALAAGFRIEFFSVGLRATLAHYADDFQVGTLAPEVTLSLPLAWLKPYIRLGFGLGWHGVTDYRSPDQSQTTVFGWAFQGALGLDLYLAHFFAIGAGFGADVLNMSRRSLDEDPGAPGDVNFTEPGDAAGIQLRGFAGISFHL